MDERFQFSRHPTVCSMVILAFIDLFCERSENHPEKKNAPRLSRVVKTVSRVSACRGKCSGRNLRAHRRSIRGSFGHSCSVRRDASGPPPWGCTAQSSTRPLEVVARSRAWRRCRTRVFCCLFFLPFAVTHVPPVLRHCSALVSATRAGGTCATGGYGLSRGSRTGARPEGRFD